MMRNRLLRAAAASAVLLLAVALPASAHSGDAASGISVDCIRSRPSSPPASSQIDIALRRSLFGTVSISAFTYW